jgi:hypothetical protein
MWTENIKVDQRCNDHLEIYFLNPLGERVSILDKNGINIIQTLFKIDLEMILEYQYSSNYFFVKQVSDG